MGWEEGWEEGWWGEGEGGGVRTPSKNKKNASEHLCNEIGGHPLTYSTASTKSSVK